MTRFEGLTTDANGVIVMTLPALPSLQAIKDAASGSVGAEIVRAQLYIYVRGNDYDSNYNGNAFAVWHGDTIAAQVLAARGTAQSTGGGSIPPINAIE